MKLLKKTKKGFTLVELIVVIAIVAILAAVSVVSYIAFINQANLSADQQAITQMNKIVQADAILNDYEYASDGLLALYKNGFNEGKMNTFSTNYHYAYSTDTNKWYLLDESDTVIYPENVSKANLWGLYNNNPSYMLDGVTNYIALNAVDDSIHFDQSFGNQNNYVLDLFKSFINVTGGHNNVEAINGIVLSGVTAGKGTNVNYKDVKTKSDVDELKNKTTINNYVFKLSGNPDEIGSTGTTVTFNDCLFVEFNVDDVLNGYNNYVFSNCKFISTTGLAIYGGSYTFDGCEFRNCERPVNITASSSRNDTDNTRTISIKNCEFYGISTTRALIQFAFSYGGPQNVSDGHGNNENGSYDGSGISKNTTIIIQNNKFYSVGSGKGVIRIHNALIYSLDYHKYTDTTTGISDDDYNTVISKISISGNTISDTINKETELVIGDSFTFGDNTTKFANWLASKF